MTEKEVKTPALVVHRILTAISTALLTVVTFFIIKEVDKVDAIQSDVQEIKIKIEHNKDTEAKVNVMWPEVIDHEVRISVIESRHKARDNADNKVGQILNGGIQSTVDGMAHNHTVVGSTPSPATMFFTQQ